MTKPINDFSDAKVGDKVTCYYGGYGTITKIMMEEDFPIGVTFGKRTEEYTLEGKIYNEDGRPSLYKGHVEFPDPIPVKRKVKKTMYTNVYLNKEVSECYRLDVYPYETIKEADDIVGTNAKHWVATAEVTFEVEE